MNQRSIIVYFLILLFIRPDLSAQPEGDQQFPIDRRMHDITAGFLKRYTDNRDSTLLYYSQLYLGDTEDHDDPLVLNRLGVLFDSTNHTDVALLFYIRALGLLQEQQEDSAVSRLQNRIAGVYITKGKYKVALEKLRENILFSMEQGYREALADAYWAEATILFNMTETDSALLVLQKMESVAKEINNKKLIAEALKITGNIYFTQARYSEALAIHLEALSFCDSIAYAHTCNEIARDHISLQHVDSALHYINLSIALRKKLEDHYGLAVSYGNTGHLYDQLAQQETAERYFDSCLTITSNYQFYDLGSWMHKSLSDYHTRQQDHQQALGHYKQYHRLQDSVAIQKKGMQFTMERVKSIAALKNQYIREQQSLLNRTLLFLYLFIGLFVLAILILIIIRLYNQKRQAELKQQLSRFQMNPHFIFNSLNSLQKYILDNDTRSSNKYLTRFSSLMRTTLENSYHDIVPIASELEHLNLYLELESMRFDHKFHYAIEVDEEILPQTMKIPSLLIQPFVENAIWHGLLHKKSEDRNLVIRLSRKEKYILCEVEDNGVGRKKAMEIKAHQKASYKSLGTKITGQRLHLLHLIYKRKFRVIYNDLTDSAGNETGTRVEIFIPINI